MTVSTAELRMWQPLFKTETVKKVADPQELKYLERDLLGTSGHQRDAVFPARILPRLANTENQYAANRAELPELGKAEPNATVSTEVRRRSNQYAEYQDSILEKRIKTFLSLEDNWDGDGAKKIPDQAIYASLNFLNDFKRRFTGGAPRSASPSADGEIVVYWYDPSRYAEINFGGSERIWMCWGDKSDEIKLIEEDLVNLAIPDKSKIWVDLSKFLGQEQPQNH